MEKNTDILATLNMKTQLYWPPKYKYKKQQKGKGQIIHQKIIYNTYTGKEQHS